MKKVLGFAKRRWKYILTALIALVIGANMGPSQEEVDAAIKKNNDLNTKIDEKDDKIASLTDDNKELSAKVKEAQPFFKLKEEERKKKEAEAKAAEEKRLAAQKAKEEAAAKEAERIAAEEQRKQEEKEKQGYNTGITYDQLARTPDNYIGEKVKFRGKVVQVLEGDGETQIRLAVNDNYDKILFASFDASIVGLRVLEDDTITIMGISAGLISYDSTMGGQISIPGVSIEKIEQ
ncbi:toxin regulator [Bacillus sp. V5-8f]|uniref:toxin regulator n=1 Tax=Bacillus sp. V5-8f TaxID=2053044 RepID=UPI000C793754|nr:toxin regulator [Bacillus sp. V5-8f]PLT32758.1 toxin regulator [Bacillus sp. V5-8f]